MSYQGLKVAVIIPCFRVKHQVLSVIHQIGPEVDMIFIIDDRCPEESGNFVNMSCDDARVQVIHHEHNLGVGGATITGYRAALALGADILVKVDGDGQMNPTLIPDFLHELDIHHADYVKGNRFYRLQHAQNMPRLRLFGNLMLSLMTKFSSGYWHIVDPTNGFTVLRSDVACELPLNEIDQGYFFESDLLFHLNLVRAVVVDIPMLAVYGAETSNLKIGRASLDFFVKNVRNTARRIAYTYFLRDLNAGSVELVFGLALFIFGIAFGSYAWINGIATQTLQSSGTVMLAALPTLLGLQLLIAFLNFDLQNTPKERLLRPDAQLLRSQFKKSHDSD